MLANKEGLDEEQIELVQNQVAFRKNIVSTNEDAKSLLVKNMIDTEVNLQFLLKESDDDDSEYGEELLNKITYSGAQALKDLQLKPSTKIMINAGQNNFIQAVMQSLICFRELLVYFLNKEYEITGADQPLCNLLSHLCTTYFLKDLKGLEQTTFDLGFMADYLAPTSFSLKAKAYASGFLKFTLNRVLKETNDSAILRSMLQVVVKEYRVCVDNHIQKDIKQVELPPISKVTQGMTINDLILKNWFTEKSVEGEDCQFCK